MGITKSLPPEWRLLLLACSTPLSTSNVDSRLQQEIGCSRVDWHRMVDCASEHDIGPRVYHSLRTCVLSGDGAQDALARLKAQYCATAIRNALLCRELTTRLTALRALGKPVVVLKGAALAATVYGDFALRPMSDFDLLIQRNDLPDIESLFARWGYSLDDGQRHRKNWYYDHHYHLTFHKRLNAALSIRCEIHWRLERPGRPFPIDTDGLWTRSVAATVASAEVRVLCPEDLLLHLCLHTCKHRLVGGFRAFCDIAEAIRHLDMDWEQVRARAFEWRIDEFVYVSLRLVQELLGANVPASMMNALRPTTVDERLLNAATAEVLTNRVSAALVRDFSHLCHGKSVKERTTTLKKVFAHHAIAKRYGLTPTSRSVYWYYPKRLKDVTVSYGPTLWQFLRHRQQAVSTMEDRVRLTQWLVSCGLDEEPV